MKKHRSHLVPLSSQAVEILNKLKVISGKYQSVFQVGTTLESQ